MSESAAATAKYEADNEEALVVGCGVGWVGRSRRERLATPLDTALTARALFVKPSHSGQVPGNKLRVPYFGNPAHLLRHRSP